MDPFLWNFFQVLKTTWSTTFHQSFNLSFYQQYLLKLRLFWFPNKPYWIIVYKIFKKFVLSNCIFVFPGRPSTPELSSEQEGLDSYSHELTWQLNSHYSILSHEIVYWESDKVSYISIKLNTIFFLYLTYSLKSFIIFLIKFLI